MTQTRIEPVDMGGGTPNWTDQYFGHLRLAGELSESAQRELRTCSEEILQNIPSPSSVLAPKTISGAVVGSVQSGKTALMIALAARALDAGFRYIIVLAGLRNDLREQTALRFTTSLLQRGDEVFPRVRDARFTHPKGRGCHGPMGDQCWMLNYVWDVNYDDAFVSTVAKRLLGGHTVLAVAKKNHATLSALRESLLHAEDRCGDLAVPTLVLDDECDEGSVSGAADAPTPDRIVDVWRTAHQYVAYIGLTATPAANLLQTTDSPLFPSSFVRVMRTPGDHESAVSFLEPVPDRRHTGGHDYYRLLAEHDRDNFLVQTAMSDAEFAGAADHHEELEEALIAYFVSGAMRLASTPDRLFDDVRRLPQPHTMLAHTELRIDSHWDLCERVVSVVKERGGNDPRVPENLRRVSPAERLRADDLNSWHSQERGRWQNWYDAFRRSRDCLLAITPDRMRSPCPSWEDVERTLPQVFRNTKLRVINSDEEASDPPLSFEPAYTESGAVLPHDVYSIVIGGNRLSRGLTIPGLCISYYTRASAIFAEDSTVQRERWFGYRGPHLEWCRLFTHRDLAIRLARFSEHEEDLRAQLAWNLADGRSPADATYRFLRLRDSMPTSKAGRGVEGALEISGARLFLDRIQMGTSSDEIEAAKHNQQIAVTWASRIDQHGERVSNRRDDTVVAKILRGIATAEVAELLESLQLTFHNPDPASGVQINLREWYRAPSPLERVTLSGLAPPNDPYMVAAYLRYWTAAYERCQLDPACDLFRARDTISRWQPIPAPAFNVGLRFGSLDPGVGSPFTHKLLNRAISTDGRLGSRWGGRGYGSAGDEWIDLPPPGGNPVAPRRADCPGLLLLHVISRDAVGRSGEGTKYQLDRPAFGIVVPEGGPCVTFVVAEG